MRIRTFDAYLQSEVGDVGARETRLHRYGWEACATTFRCDRCWQHRPALVELHPEGSDPFAVCQLCLEEALAALAEAPQRVLEG